METKTDQPADPTVFINVPIPQDLHRRLRIRQATDGLVMRDAVIAALEEWLKP